MFAGRTEWDLTPNALALKRDAMRRSGAQIFDLTETNPTRCGFAYPQGLLDRLSDQRALSYNPDPKGMLSARRAVASVYAAKGVSADPAQIFLTASTSEAYGFLFRLLCDPGDEILVPRPSYPLFDYLAQINDIRPVSYPLRYGKRWEIDWERLRESVTSRTRAVVAVHPNNPTGSCLTRQEVAGLTDLCRKYHLTLISDEVFAEYRYPAEASSAEWGGGIPGSLLGSSDELLIFALGGLSKFLGLPQMKLAWAALSGPEALLLPALERLELIADTFLSVNTPVQAALPDWLTLTHAIQRQIRRRIESNRSLLLEKVAGSPAACLKADGGWTAVLKAPSVRDEESWVVRLLEEAHVLVHPGYLFDFEEPGMLVVSLLTPESVFGEGVQRLVPRLHPS